MFAFSPQGFGGDQTVTRTINVSLYMVNEPAKLTVGRQHFTTLEDTPIAIPGASITDDFFYGESTTLVMNVSAVNGFISLGSTDNIRFLDGNGTLSKTQKFYGNVSALNATLKSLSYHPAANYNGMDGEEIVFYLTEHFSTNVSGGNDRMDLFSETTTYVGITVTPVNDPPVLTSPPSFSMTNLNTVVLQRPDGSGLGSKIETPSIHLAGLKVFDLDLDEDSAGLLKIVLSVENGTLSTLECAGVHFIEGNCAVGTGEDRLISDSKTLCFFTTNGHAQNVLSTLHYHADISKIGCGGTDELVIKVNDDGDPSMARPSRSPLTAAPTDSPNSISPTIIPTTGAPTPSTSSPSGFGTTAAPTIYDTMSPTQITPAPVTTGPTQQTSAPTSLPTEMTASPTTAIPATVLSSMVTKTILITRLC